MTATRASSGNGANGASGSSAWNVERDRHEEVHHTLWMFYRVLYICHSSQRGHPNLLLNQELAVMNIGTPTFMRAPVKILARALESAMDELAWARAEARSGRTAAENEAASISARDCHSPPAFCRLPEVGAERLAERQTAAATLTRDGKLVGCR